MLCDTRKLCSDLLAAGRLTEQHRACDSNPDVEEKSEPCDPCVRRTSHLDFWSANVPRKPRPLRIGTRLQAGKFHFGRMTARWPWRRAEGAFWTRSRRSVLVDATWWSSSTARVGRFTSSGGPNAVADAGRLPRNIFHPVQMGCELACCRQQCVHRPTH